MGHKDMVCAAYEGNCKFVEWGMPGFKMITCEHCDSQWYLGGY